MLARRGFLGGLLATPAIIRTPGLLMAVRPLRRWYEIEYVRNTRTTPLRPYAGPFNMVDVREIRDFGRSPALIGLSQIPTTAIFSKSWHEEWSMGNLTVPDWAFGMSDRNVLQLSDNATV